MDEFRAFEAWLATVKYKPNWRFGAQLPFHLDAAVVVHARAKVPDVNNPERVTTVAQSRHIPGVLLKHPEAWPDILRELVIGFELHEVDEWLSIDGERLNDPHPKS